MVEIVLPDDTVVATGVHLEPLSRPPGRSYASGAEFAAAGAVLVALAKKLCISIGGRIIPFMTSRPPSIGGVWFSPKTTNVTIDHVTVSIVLALEYQQGKTIGHVAVEQAQTKDPAKDPATPE